jgi:hypothetical protein
MKKLIPKSRFTGRMVNPDTLKERERLLHDDQKKFNLPLLTRAEAAWMAQAETRKEWLRNLRYVRGDQWSDYVEDENGERVLERNRIAARTGGVALQNNHLIKIVNTLMGIYSRSATMPVCFARQDNADAKSQMMTRALQTNWDNNEMKDLLEGEFFQMIVGGTSIVKEVWAEQDGVDDSYTYKVDLGHAFWEAEGTDPRHWDISMIGEFRDYTIGELAATFAESEYDYNQLLEIYKPYLSQLATIHKTRNDYSEGSWNYPMTTNLCRVYEIWTKEHKPGIRCKDIMNTEQPLYHIDPRDLPNIQAENERRIALGREQGIADDDIPLIEYKGKGLGYKIYEYWHYWALTPDGRILVDYDSPFEHGSHPYTIKMHLYANGRTTPFISCIIDQQRYINRLITLNDLLINSSIKSLKMIPKDLIPKGMSQREFARQAVELDGWVFYEPQNRMTNAEPKVITQNATNIGIHELLQVQLSSINDITNVHGALQGKAPNAGTSAQLYLMESQNATTSIATLLNKFSRFENNVARKKMKTIHQYYQEPRNISVEQSSGYVMFQTYDPKAVRDIDFDVKISEAAETPVSRMFTNKQLEEWAAAGWIDLHDVLTYGYYPNLEELKQRIAASKEMVEQANGGVPVQGDQVQGVNQETAALLQNILRGNGGVA